MLNIHYDSSDTRIGYSAWGKYVWPRFSDGGQDDVQSEKPIFSEVIKIEPREDNTIEDYSKRDRRHSTQLAAIIVSSALAIGAVLFGMERNKKSVMDEHGTVETVTKKVDRVLVEAKASEPVLIAGIAPDRSKAEKKTGSPKKVAKPWRPPSYARVKALVNDTEVNWGKLMLKELRKWEHRVYFVTDSGRMFYFKVELKKNARLLTKEWLSAWTMRKLAIAESA